MTAWFTALPWVYHLDFQRKERYHAARFEKDTRYYVIRLSKDLLEDRIITLINGRIKSKSGQNRTLAFANFNEAFDSFSVSKPRYAINGAIILKPLIAIISSAASTTLFSACREYEEGACNPK